MDPGKAFDDYERSYIARIKTPYRPVSAAVNATCMYYMPAAARRQAGGPGSPSGNDFLADALNRPRRHKRKE